ncbi:hypothetical protein RRG08_028430 [Elysia crispata]|uniref:RING-type domain-containing protein n=1 Tax=Elysia crispata TaxID=231223 RepID=A0AAE1E4K0_9GAST|nr:hypothetical protein RRG08_028430 [Elysia crispata]
MELGISQILSIPMEQKLTKEMKSSGEQRKWLALREVSKSKYLNVANQSIIMDQNQTKTKYKYCDKSQGGNEEGNNSITLNDNEKAGNHCEVKVLNACLVESQVKNNDESKELDADCSEEDSLCEKDSCPRHMSSSCASRNIFDHHGFQMRPQTLTVYTLDTYTAQNLTVVGSIPWAWLREEKWRLHTFAKYPHNTSKSAILLAEDGFAYIGSGKDSDDTVICFFCRGMKRAWREDEDIRQAHRALSPDCPMVNGTGGGNIPLIAPENVSFGRTQFAAGGQNDIEKDCSPDLSQEAGQAGPNRQHQQHSKAQSGSNKPKAPVQLATYTVMCASSRPQRITQHQAVGNTTALDQASDDRGASSIVTSSNTAPSFVKADDVSGQNHGSQQSAQRQAAAATGHTNPNLPRIGNESRNVPDGGNRPTPTNLLSAPSEPATQSARPSSASQSLPPTTSTPSSTGATVIQSSTPHTVAQSSAPNTATQSPPPNTVTQSSTTTPSSQSSTPSTNPPPVPQNPTYLELGIITERPKRYEYAVRIKRLETFGDWPADHHLKKEDLADAGFYYAGYGDCARCFYCGGGLRNWEQDDDVWVEHARWFPKCAFIRQRLGQVFIDTVALLAQTNDKISFQMVVSEMKIDPSAFQIDSKETPLKNDAAVLAVREMGFQEKDIIPVAATLKESGQILSADILFTALEDRKVPRKPVNINTEANNLSVSVNTDKAKDEELLNTLKQTNNDLRLQTLCKICMDKEVAVVFLPCGHLVCCTECASAMKDCPVCRNQVKGIVRAFMG